MEVLTAAGSIVSAADESGFHKPTIAEFFPAPFLFAGSPFEFNRVMMLRVISTVVICAIFWIAARRMKLVPSRGQSMIEMSLDFVRVSIVEETMGKKKGEQFLPLITTLFFMVFAMNITGVIPFLNISSTSVVGVPLLLAIIVYFTYHIAGIKAQGIGPYLKNALILPGVPPAMHILLIPIEFLTKFVIQPFTLTLRLLCNMIVGHLLLVLAFSATWFFFFDASLGFKAFGFLTFVGGFGITLLELLIAVLQAYIFALLATVYINQSTEAEH